MLGYIVVVLLVSCVMIMLISKWRSERGRRQSVAKLYIYIYIYCSTCICVYIYIYIYARSQRRRRESMACWYATGMVAVKYN